MSDTVTISPLRKMLQRFNENLGIFINAEERFKLGRVLTIIDASMADPEQRKAVKDLIQNEWWNGNGARPANDSNMHNPHSDLRAICRVLGFELYERTTSTPSGLEDSEEWLTKQYKDIANE